MDAPINWSFAEMCERAASVDEVQEIFICEVRRLGFSYAACASHVDPLRPPKGAVMMVDYPREWLERFSAKDYARHDPIFRIARQEALPFRWSMIQTRWGLSATQAHILREASEFGLGDGFTIPIHAPGALPASCSLAIGTDGVDPLMVHNAQWYAFYAHESARRLLLNLTPPQRKRLSPRERECIEYVARGKSDFDIGHILGVSEHTVHNTVRNAMKKLGVASRIQAFARALHSHEIRIEDVVD